MQEYTKILSTIISISMNNLKISITAFVLLLPVTLFPVVFPKPVNAEFDFFAASDMHGYTGSGAYNTTSYFRGAAEKMFSLAPSSFLFITGDMPPIDLSGSTLDITWSIEQYLGASYEWHPVMGNHEFPGNGTEDYSGQNLDILRAFDHGTVNPGPSQCDETTFSFDHDNAHFVALNEYCDTGGDHSIDGDISDVVYNWLVTDLSSTTAEHIFLFGHEPAYPQPDEDNGASGHMTDSLNKYTSHRDRFWTLLGDYNADAFFSGHMHTHSTYYYDGVWQMNIGHSQGIAGSSTKSSFMRMHINGGQVTYESYRDDQLGGPYSLVETLNTYTVATDVNTGGSISPSGHVHINEEEDQIFTIEKNTGYHIDDVIVDSVSQGVIFEYEFSSVSGNHTIEVIFDTNLLNEDACLDFGGTWLSAYSECQSISSVDCINYNGSYNSCASPCRHESADFGCLQTCIPVCTFEGGGGMILQNNEDNNSSPSLLNNSRKLEVDVKPSQSLITRNSIKEIELVNDKNISDTERVSFNSNVIPVEKDQDMNSVEHKNQNVSLLILLPVLIITIPFFPFVVRKVI
jgi:hypothetical protein